MLHTIEKDILISAEKIIIESIMKKGCEPVLPVISQTNYAK